MSAVLEWIRPWYPAGLTGHIYRDCPDLVKYVSEPVEGAGWLSPRHDAAFHGHLHHSTCAGCLNRYDPKLAAELAKNRKATG